MFQVLVFVYENYWRGDACPELPQLHRKLSVAGFDEDEIQQALVWLEGLNVTVRGTQPSPAANAVQPAAPVAAAEHSLRVFTVAEQDHLGAECLGYVRFLESAGVLSPTLREIVLDRGMAAPGQPVSLDDLKIIILLVYWSFGAEPDALVLDELSSDRSTRLAH